MENPNGIRRWKKFFCSVPAPGTKWKKPGFTREHSIFKFRGVDTISAAEELCGAEVRIPIEQRTPLGEGEFFQDDLVGCQLVDRSTGQSLGTVSGWEDGGGSGLLVTGDGMLIPFARSICVEIDPAAKRIAVDLPEGLKDLNRP